MALFSLQMLKKLMELEIRFKGARPSFFYGKKGLRN